MPFWCGKHPQTVAGNTPEPLPKRCGNGAGKVATAKRKHRIGLEPTLLLDTFSKQRPRPLGHITHVRRVLAEKHSYIKCSYGRSSERFQKRCRKGAEMVRGASCAPHHFRTVSAPFRETLCAPFLFRAHFVSHSFAARILFHEMVRRATHRLSVSRSRFA